MNLKQGDHSSQDQHTGKQKQAGDETAPDRLFSHFRTGSIVGKDFIDGRI